MTSHHLTGTTLGRVLRLLRRNRVRPAALPRLVPILWVGAWASFWSRREDALFGERLRAQAPPRDPIIIVGHWRTGSTFLHQLLNLDPHLTAPTTLQCSIPTAFLVARPYIEPIMRRTLGPTRPMDQVRLSPAEPQEDEFALLRLVDRSPLERLIFSRSSRYFLLDAGPRFLDGGDAGAWGEALVGFVKKVGFSVGKRVVLKNPFHSVRIPLLESLFPEARYIHIRRNPLAVIPSTRRMWTIMAGGHTLGPHGVAPKIAELVAVYRHVLATLQADGAAIPKERWTEVRFEDLETDPLATLRALHARLDLPFPAAHEVRVRGFLHGLRGFRKNRYSLAPAEEALIREELGGEIEQASSRAPREELACPCR